MWAWLIMDYVVKEVRNELHVWPVTHQLISIIRFTRTGLATGSAPWSLTCSSAASSRRETSRSAMCQAQYLGSSSSSLERKREEIFLSISTHYRSISGGVRVTVAPCVGRWSASSSSPSPLSLRQLPSSSPPSSSSSSCPSSSSSFCQSWLWQSAGVARTLRRWWRSPRSRGATMTSSQRWPATIFSPILPELMLWMEVPPWVKPSSPVDPKRGCRRIKRCWDSAEACQRGRSNIRVVLAIAP